MAQRLTLDIACEEIAIMRSVMRYAADAPTLEEARSCLRMYLALGVADAIDLQAVRAVLNGWDDPRKAIAE